MKVTTVSDLSELPKKLFQKGKHPSEVSNGHEGNGNARDEESQSQSQSQTQPSDNVVETDGIEIPAQTPSTRFEIAYMEVRAFLGIRRRGDVSYSTLFMARNFE